MSGKLVLIIQMCCYKLLLCVIGGAGEWLCPSWLTLGVFQVKCTSLSSDPMERLLYLGGWRAADQVLGT